VTDDEAERAKNHLIDEAVRLCPQKFEASSTLISAGFSILAIEVGLSNAREAIPHLAQEFAKDLPHPN
jgi:hypothetical protein